MTSPAEISSSAKLLLDEMRKLFDEHNAWLDRRFAGLAASVEPAPAPSTTASVATATTPSAVASVLSAPDAAFGSFLSGEATATDPVNALNASAPPNIPAPVTPSPATPSVAAPSAGTVALSVTEEQAAEQNAHIAACLAYCFSAASSLAVYCRDPTTLASLTPHGRSGRRSVKLVRWHERLPTLDAGAIRVSDDMLLTASETLAEMDTEEFRPKRSLEEENHVEANNIILAVPILTASATSNAEDEVSSTLPNGCSMNCVTLIQSCFSLPTCYLWDALLYRQHRPWPPPTELRLLSCDAGLRPLPWPSEQLTVNWRSYVLSKPSWIVSTAQSCSEILDQQSQIEKHVSDTSLEDSLVYHTGASHTSWCTSDFCFVLGSNLRLDLAHEAKASKSRQPSTPRILLWWFHTTQCHVVLVCFIDKEKVNFQLQHNLSILALNPWRVSCSVITLVHSTKFCLLHGILLEFMEAIIDIFLSWLVDHMILLRKIRHELILWLPPPLKLVELKSCSTYLSEVSMHMSVVRNFQWENISTKNYWIRLLGNVSNSIGGDLAKAIEAHLLDQVIFLETVSSDMTDTVLLNNFQKAISFSVLLQMLKSQAQVTAPIKSRAHITVSALIVVSDYLLLLSVAIPHSGTAGATLTWKFSGWLGCCALGFLNLMGSRINRCSWSLHMHFDVACIEFAILMLARPQMISQFMKPAPTVYNEDLFQLIEQSILYCKSTAQFLMLLPSLDVHCSAYVQSTWLPPCCHCLATCGFVVLPLPWPPDHSAWSSNSKMLVAAILAPWNRGCSVLQVARGKVLQLSCHFLVVLLAEFWSPVWLAAYTFKAHWPLPAWACWIDNEISEMFLLSTNLSYCSRLSKLFWPPLMAPVYLTQLKCGGLTQFEYLSLSDGIDIINWRLTTEMRYVNTVVQILTIPRDMADVLVWDGSVILVCVSDLCMSTRGHHLLSNIWPVQTKQQLFSTIALLNIHQLGVSMVVNLEDCNKQNMHSFELSSILNLGDLLIQCGGSCRCFMLEVTGQKFRVATSCTKCKVFCWELLLLDMGFLTTNKEVQYNVDRLSSTYSDQEFPQFPWDPGGSDLLHRLGGKPKLKKGGMSGTAHGWAFIWAVGMGLVELCLWTVGSQLQESAVPEAWGINELYRELAGC